MSSTTFTVPSSTALGKRKAPGDPNYVLRLASSPEPTAEYSESEYEPKECFSENAPESPKRRPILLNGKIVAGDTKRRYACTYDGCTKAYTKPSRLAEHERSHTGQRPFVCSICNKSYLRESHLQAHARSHLPDSEKPFVCPQENCNKRFWTQQHLRTHVDWHNGAKPFACSEPECNEAFPKHHQLRTHKCTAHAPPGTKPYPCTHPGCTKSFDTNQHLRTHFKVHNEKRYTCAHQTCLPTPGTAAVFYPTWTALQHHMRTAHPPTCPHPQCRGKTFTSQKGLRAHQKLHEEREIEAEINACAVDSDAEATHPPRKKRRGGEMGRDWRCEVQGCGKDFKSSKALAIHHKVTHLGRRDFVCLHKGCERTFGYKHLLQRHQAKVHVTSGSSSESDSRSSSDDTPSEDEETGAKVAKTTIGMNIDTLTGVSYTARSKQKLQNGRALHCPFPELDAIIHRRIQSAPQLSDSTCNYVFSRAYDLRRHLKAFHEVEADKESVEAWVVGAKSSQKS
ncbi:transcription factor iiia [Moniliophthora roreri MCA 2997]|uniref:Transcription factor iiia n=2 Tax=Moniliophthora roreri TaxID=221103 RepID=V2X3I7_MONRO|nr:transcription factor iiia [Moniliophthora roreri MCA 2997]KAI3609644.1 transcription factor iiia [Moniliophthora roreri]